MPFEQAVIEIDKKDLGGKFPPRFNVQFNPTEYTRAKGAQIAEIALPGIDAPVLQFVRGQNEKLTLDLLFDTTEHGMGEDGVVPVTNLTEPFYQLVKLQSNTHAPPRLTFQWGEKLSFRAVVESIQQKFTLFNPLGIPLRAILTVTFAEYKTLEEQLSELNLQSPDHTKLRVVRAGDTLPNIAFEEYGDADLWRPIADANPSIGNLRRLLPGTELVLPPVDIFAARRTS